MSKQKTLHLWNSFFIEKGLSENLRESYLVYISALLDENVPVIFEFHHLSMLLGRDKAYLASVVNSPESHYTSFKIKKRSGGEREITMPFPALLEMQYWILNNILRNRKVHFSAHGFAYKKSIVTNAKLHLNQKEILKLDLTNFFTSINLSRIIFLFKSFGYPNKIAFYLASLCSYEKYLPQGAPTSPMLSNLIAKQLDERLIRFAKRFNLKYSRYADDLTFSGEQIPVKFIEYISSIINEEGFSVNNSKTRLYKKSCKRIVTGISVSGEALKLPRSYKRSLKQELHYIFLHGFHSHVAKKRIRKSNYLNSLIGKVNFWLSIEPNNEYALISKVKLKEILDQMQTISITSDSKLL